MKIFKTAEFFDDNGHTKKYYLCGIRYLKKRWAAANLRETYLFKFKISGHKKIVLSEQEIELRDDGISIIGLGDISGEGKTGKAAIQSLLKSDINFDNGTFNDICCGYIPGFKKQLVFSTSNFYKNPRYDIIPLLVWEFESGMSPVRPWAFKDIYAIATFSTFCAKYFKKIAPQDMKITVLPYPVDIDLAKLEPQKTVRAKYNIKPRDFVFFFNFSYASSYFRKNPEGTLAAFALAFPKHENNIKLVIKTICANSAPNMVARLNAKIQELGLENNIILINQDLTDDEQYSLINCCDVYVSLHRGEGLGLGMMEAMYMAKPVIATNYGGNTDFTTPDTALMVDYKMVKPQEIDIDAYKYVEKWPEPNIKTAAHHMRALYDNPKLRKQIGTAGQNFIKQNFNSDRFNSVVESDLIWQKQEIDIIVPVYNGYEYLENLFNSILNNTDLPYRLIVVNDKSTDARVDNLLKHYKTIFGTKMELINNKQNLGFVKSVNAALKKIKNHVVLINTDVVLPKEWASRLFYPIFTNKKIASVTPFSNAATIFSIPTIGINNELSVELENINSKLRKIKCSYENLTFPTGVGFCMAMNKDVIRQIGVLDEIYEKGYGEENDWCQRATHAGFINTVAGNLFVWHKHGGSFLNEEKKRLQEKHLKIVLQRYPNYAHDVQKFIENPTFLRLRFIAELFYYNLLAINTEINVTTKHKRNILYLYVCHKNKDNYEIVYMYNEHKNSVFLSINELLYIISLLNNVKMTKILI